MHFCEKCLKCYFSGNKIFDASDVIFFLITISFQAELQSADDKNRIDQSFCFHLYFVGLFINFYFIDKCSSSSVCINWDKKRNCNCAFEGRWKCILNMRNPTYHFFHHTLRQRFLYVSNSYSLIVDIRSNESCI